MNGSPRRVAWLGTLSLLFLLALFARTVPGASEMARQVPGVQVIPVQGNVYMLEFPNTLGNIGVLPGPDGVLLIDDQVPGMTDNVIRGVRQITDEEIRFVVNTHVHMDHFGGNPILADMGATIISHKNVRDRMFQAHHTPRRGGTYAAAPISEAARPPLTFDAIPAGVDQLHAKHRLGQRERAKLHGQCTRQLLGRLVAFAGHDSGDREVGRLGLSQLAFGRVHLLSHVPRRVQQGPGFFSGLQQACLVGRVAQAGPLEQSSACLHALQSRGIEVGPLSIVAEGGTDVLKLGGRLSRPRR